MTSPDVPRGGDLAESAFRQAEGLSDAIAETIHVAGQHGADAALEWLGDWCNGHDLVDDQMVADFAAYKTLATADSQKATDPPARAALADLLRTPEAREAVAEALHDRNNTYPQVRWSERPPHVQALYLARADAALSALIGLLTTNPVSSRLVVERAEETP